MKKTLLSFALAALSTASFAQVPDASAWKAGDEITDKIAWGNLSFNNKPLDSWQVTTTTGNPCDPGQGLMEVWNGSGCDVFQYVLLPKGQYRISCQGYYRFGASEGEYESYNDNSYQDNALIYAQDGTYNVDANKFTAGNLRFENPLMPRLFEQKSTYLFSGDATEWKNDQNYTVDGVSLWGPCSIEGSLLWFADNRFLPYSDDKVTYNQVDFFVTDDSYMRVGVTKNEAKSGDSFMVTNFKMYYLGEIADGAELVAKIAAYNTAYKNIQNRGREIENGEYGSAFSEKVLDLVDGCYVKPSTLTSVDACNAALNTINQANAKIDAALLTYDAIVTTMKQSNHLVLATDYPGKEAFLVVVNKGNDLTNPESTSSYTLEEYEAFKNEIAKARLDYIMSQQNENGEYDFTSAISYPWFCLPEYEPTWDAESNWWKANEDALNTDSGDGKTWADKNDTSGTINNIAAGVNVYATPGTPGVWAQGGTAGGNLEVYWEAKLTCVKKWSDPYEGYHDVSQLVTNIPNGWYRARGLAKTWNNNWTKDDCKNQIYIKSSTMESFSPYLQDLIWWDNDIRNWRELETELIQVTDNQVTVAFRDNGFSAFTGMRLFYYGDSINFDTLLADRKAAFLASVENLRLLGDKAKANELYNKVPSGIKTIDVFMQAKEDLSAAESYLETAKKSEDEFESVIGTLDALVLAHDAYGPIQTEAFRVSSDETEGLTYEGELPCKAAYEALNSYYAFADNIYDWLSSSEVAPVLARHEADLKLNYRSAEKIIEYQAELEYAYHQAYFAANTINEATEANPKEITEFITNPDYSNGKTGWTCTGGTLKVDKFYNGEIYEDPEYDLNQTILGLPAGCYKLQVQAFYRDGGLSLKSLSLFADSASSDVEQWQNHNVVLYANDATTFVKSIYSQKYTNRVMTKHWTGESDQEGRIYKDISEYTEDEIKNHPWDGYVDSNDYDDDFNSVRYWYPNSTEGACYCFEDHPDDYVNTIYVMIEAGEKLSFGFRKANKRIGADWLIFANWKLSYLGTETPVAVESVDSASSEVKVIYNAAGIKTNKQVKGINIIKMADGSVKKVAVK